MSEWCVVACAKGTLVDELDECINIFVMRTVQRIFVFSPFLCYNSINSIFCVSYDSYSN